jgi:enoyl-CoA hydratase
LEVAIEVPVGRPEPLGRPLWRQEVDALAQRLASIPMSQLAAMKLVVNQAYDNMGLQTTQTLGPLLDGIMRNTPEGRAFVRLARDQGVPAAVAHRDAPFGDYGQAPPEAKPRRRSELT